MSTATVITALATQYPTRKNWKRVVKYTNHATAIRVFKDSEGFEVTTFEGGHLEDEEGTRVTGVLVREGNLFPPTPPTLLEALKKAANQIKHCGDYCHLHWNAALGHAWMTMGDGDCGEDEGCPFTSMDEIKRLLTEAGAKAVFVEAECDPEVQEGWRFLGAFGKTVSWE